MGHMRRRDFIRIASAAAIVWPRVASAQRAGPIRKIGVLLNFSSGDLEGQARVSAFVQTIRKLGWIEGDNLRSEIRWAGDNDDRYHTYAKELVESASDVIVASAGPSVAALQNVTQIIPIVFASVIDPVGAGFIASMARPGGNATGFTAFEYSISAKWLELLNELAPGLKRIAVLREPSVASGIGQFAAIQTVASSSSELELTAIDPHDAGSIEKGLAALAREPNGGVIITASSWSARHRDLLFSLAARYRLPTVAPYRYHAMSGAFAAYGPDTITMYVRAADYVDRILKGEKPADLPVQAPTRYELVINLKTAQTLGITVSPSLLARADEVIE
jgi:putative tryptophan/tyrosine transport system substrate-binding protein